MGFTERLSLVGYQMTVLGEIMTNLYSKDDCINQFLIDYIIKPSLYVNKLLIEQVEKCLNATLYEETIKNIRDVLKKKNTSVIVIIMFYHNKGVKPNNCIQC